MNERPLLEAHLRADHVTDAIAEFQKATLDEVRAAVAKHDVVVIGMAQNPHVKNVRRTLDEAGVKFTYLEYGSYVSAWKPRLAIKLWSGWPTFPQVFVKGILIGGAAATKAAIADGSLTKRLAASSAG